MAYLPSNKILVFPAVARDDAYQKDARLLTEESMARTLKLAHNNGSFVVSTLDNIQTDGIKFVIDGYYVEADFTSVVSATSLSNGQHLYAKIVLTSASGYTELTGSDNNGEYQGVEFTTIQPSASDIYIDICTMGATAVQTINTPPIVDGDVYVVKVRKGIGSPSSIKKGEVYLDYDVNTKALYIGIDDNNNTLKLEPKDTITDIECNTIKVDGGITGSSAKVQVNGDTASASVSTQSLTTNSASIGQNADVYGKLTTTKIIQGLAPLVTTIEGNQVTTGIVSASNITSSSSKVTLGSGKTLSIPANGELENNGTTTLKKKLTITSGGADVTGNASVTGAVSVSGNESVGGDLTVTGSESISNGLTVNKGTSTNAITATGKITATGGFFSNGLIAPLYSTTMPSDFNSADVVGNTRIYSSYISSDPANSPSLEGSYVGPKIATLEVFHSESSGAKYCIQRYTIMSSPLASTQFGPMVFHRTGIAMPTTWTFSSWR